MTTPTSPPGSPAPEGPSPRERLAGLARRVLAADGVRLHGDLAALRADALLAPAVDGPLVVTDAVLDARTAAAPEVLAGDVGALLAVPLLAGDRPVGALAVHSASPRPWTEDEVAVLVELAAAVVTEGERGDLADELESSRLRWGLAIEAAGVGGFDLDVATSHLEWDDRLIAIFGYDPATFGRSLADFEARLHPEDRDRVMADVTAAVEAVGDFASEYRIVLPGGVVRWISARGRALHGGDGRLRLLGAAYDVTDVQSAEAGVRRVLESMSAAFYSVDREWRFTYVNAEAERLLGRRRDELLGRVVWDLFPAAAEPGSPFDVEYRRAVAEGRPRTFEAYYPAPLDGWYEVRAFPVDDGLSVYFTDVTERRALQEREVQEAARREVLSRVSAELAATLDPEAAVARLARLVVPLLADWSVVTLVRDDGRLQDVGWWHAEEDLRPLVEVYARHRLEALDDASYLDRALAVGQLVEVPEPAHVSIARVLRPGRAAEVLATLAPRWATIVPLVARGRTLGVLTVFRGAGREGPGEEDMAVARQLAERAGVGLDNARLYRAQLSLAEELQRSLLTAPPAPDHTEIAVRYVPAAEAARVGGDWYDAFLQRSGDTVVVIGDVVGHDTAAAAAMGQLRGLLRGIAFHHGAGPAETLAGLDAAMEGLLLETTATAVVVRVEQTPDMRAEGLTRLRWSNAGHPPPMLATPDGEVHQLLAARTDLLLGILPDTRRHEGTAVVDRGSTLLLYTDGLVERRDQGLQEGLARLRRELSDVAHLPLEEVLDELLERLRPEASHDDVALLAVRLHPQDGPRPAEAGPEVVPPEVPPDLPA
ncbi:SpoIIE family protein phosphatase [uncultured Pseudokineococcus sp.]|uniref:SpoIIE family protein phosphatase n=1 Tax=uncultured Pseudokineococcus sp. TaxID=1642928 RepID=UPI002619B5B7|nr:SpoIIE family protein phosphatase [uncultured Pseudokineococcus sp.]